MGDEFKNTAFKTVKTKTSLLNFIKLELYNLTAVYWLVCALTILIKQLFFIDKFNLLKYKLFIRSYDFTTLEWLNVDEFSSEIQEDLLKYVEELEIKESALELYILNQRFWQFKINFFNSFLYCNFFFYDIVMFLLTRSFKKSNVTNNIWIFSKLNYENQYSNKGIYSFLTNQYKQSLSFNKLSSFSHLFIGLKYVWKAFRLWFLPLFLSFSIIYFGLIIKLLPFNKIIFLWTSLIMVIYWLVSGFVFFFKKYQFGKYTSAIQRFWKRSYILFWLLESCLLLVFVYLTFNASQESFRMFDQTQIYKTHLFSWRLFFLKIFPLVVLIGLSTNFLLMLKSNIISKLSFWLALMTVILTFLVWLEFYQFFHIINFYGNLSWVYDIDERIWNLEADARRTRIVNHSNMWLMTLKFWHIIFVFIVWIFSVLRNSENQRVRYPLLSANLQNLIIVYLMSWLTMYPWFKIIFRKFLDLPYFWFFSSNRSTYLRGFFNDLKLINYGLFNLLDALTSTSRYNYLPFYYWHASANSMGFTSYRKYYIKDIIVNLISTIY